jgi:hypothetical protein
VFYVVLFSLMNLYYNGIETSVLQIYYLGAKNQDSMAELENRTENH